MCHTSDKETRRRVAIANGCVAAGLILSLFVHPSEPVLKDVVHGVAGLLLGISIGVNLNAVICRRRGQRVSA